MNFRGDSQPWSVFTIQYLFTIHSVVGLTIGHNIDKTTCTVFLLIRVPSAIVAPPPKIYQGFNEHTFSASRMQK